ncbi:MAG: hypothetical protein JNM40_01680 [Myxococcales bacterium]|nr:hypothetical protein [Myxococcales bacterium]
MATDPSLSAAAPHKSKNHRDRLDHKQPAASVRSLQAEQLATGPIAPIDQPEANPSSQSSSVRPERPSLGDSATAFARGFAKGVSEEGRQIYQDTKELPARLAKTGREIVDDVQAGRELRALAPLHAMERAVRNASRDDVERVARGVIVATKDWLDKPAYEKGESLGRATTSLAADAAIGVFTEGLGTIGALRKVERTAEAADHVRDVERVAAAAAKDRPTRFVSGTTVIDRRTGTVLEGTVDLKPTLDRIESGGRFPHRNDGAVFQNRPLPGRDTPSLPNQSPGYYREYVHPTPGTHGTGPQRVVIGKGGEMYYTPDHYQTFVPLK